MLFTSLEYIIFLPIIVILYYLIPIKFKWVLLLISSYYFYAAWDIRYLIPIIFSTLMAYFFAQWISNTNSNAFKKTYLSISVVLGCSLLFFFKYYTPLLDIFLPQINTTNVAIDNFYDKLPLGLSFYTLQYFSYLIDVFRGKIQAERHIGKFALYIAYFPRLLAGPIERAGKLLPQFSINKAPNYIYFREGVVLLLWGFFKKVVIANRLGYYVELVFSSPDTHTGFVSLLAIFFFYVQIYCDISAYADIARGSSLFFGIRLSSNFRLPFFAINTISFINRWHLTLTRWFRDYIYTPLVGNNGSKLKIFIVLCFVYTLLAIWHGLQWHYMVSMHLIFFASIIGFVTRTQRRNIFLSLNINYENKGLIVFDILLTFLIIMVALVFFRANSVQDALHILSNVSKINVDTIINSNLYDDIKDFHIALLSVGILFLFELFVEKYGYTRLFYKILPRFVRYILVLLLIIAIMLLWGFQNNEFIYFKY